MMKAIVFNQYGIPEEVLGVEEIEIPVPKDGEVLIRVISTAINDYDWSLVRGKPNIYRLMFGIKKPKHNIPGMELAGVVEKVGSKVKSLDVGDEVFGDISASGFGAFAEYVCVNEKDLVIKPSSMSFDEAAAIPHASLLAWQAFQDKGAINIGKTVLINGAGGGVGTFGLQLARLSGCTITGVDTGAKLDMMREIGYDHVLDYKQADFTKSKNKYDFILDCKSNKSVFSYYRALKPGGRYITVGGSLFTLLKILFLGTILTLFSSKQIRILSLKSNKGLDHINKLFDQKKLKCILDGPYPLERVPGLINYFGEGKHQGKVVIRLPDAVNSE